MDWNLNVVSFILLVKLLQKLLDDKSLSFSFQASYQSSKCHKMVPSMFFGYSPNTAGAILWLMIDNGLLWVTKGDDFSSIDFLSSLLG
jgi:hypothetical protein